MTSVPDIVPVSELRQDAAAVIKRAASSQEPVFITQRGRTAAVMLSTQTYARTQRELAILRQPISPGRERGGWRLCVQHSPVRLYCSCHFPAGSAWLLQR